MYYLPQPLVHAELGVCLYLGTDATEDPKKFVLIAFPGPKGGMHHIWTSWDKLKPLVLDGKIQQGGLEAIGYFGCIKLEGARKSIWPKFMKAYGQLQKIAQVGEEAL